MARYCANSSGNLSTAGIWDTVTNTPTIHASTNINIASTGILSATFTAPNTTNKCTGFVVFLESKPTGVVTLTGTLQESGVDKVSVTIANADMPPSTAGANIYMLYFRFASPYTFTTTGAGAYKFKLVASVTSGRVRADSGAANFAYYATDDRNTAPVAGDDLLIVAPSGSTAITVTVDGTSGSVGAGTDTTAISVTTSTASVGQAIQIHGGSAAAILKWDTAANATLQVKGNICVGYNAETQMGTVATPYPAAQLAKLVFDQNGTSGNYGIGYFVGARNTMQGAPKSSTSLWKTTYASGSGTAADPLIVADAVDWTVGDEIIVGATSANATNYNECEKRFIITKNSATSYVISSSSGGAEAALTFTHNTNAVILNLQRNVLITTTNIAQGVYSNSFVTNAGDYNMDWVRIEQCGSTTASKTAWAIEFGASSVANCDYSVAYNVIGRGFALQVSTGIATSCTGLIGVYSTVANNNGACFELSANGHTFTDCYALSNARCGFELVSSNSNTFIRCIAIGCNTAGGTQAGAWLIGGAKNTFTNCEVHCTRIQAINLNGATDLVATNFLMGTKGINQTVDVQTISNTYNTATFTNSTFGSATTITNYLNMLDGSEIRFHALGTTTNNHFWYTKYGSGRSTGSGLGDTTVRTPGSLGVALRPEDATTGFTWSFQIPANAGNIAYFLANLQKNATFGTSVATVNLFLPSNTTTTPDATTTLSNVTGSWQTAVLSANDTDSIPGLATITIVAKSSTAGAYLYIDDLYNAGDTVTNYDKVAGLDVWYNGKPISIIQSLPASVTAISAAIWAFPTTNLTTASTTGKKLMDNLTTAKFIGLK